MRLPINFIACFVILLASIVAASVSVFPAFLILALAVLK